MDYRIDQVLKPHAHVHQPKMDGMVFLNMLANNNFFKGQLLMAHNGRNKSGILKYSASLLLIIVLIIILLESTNFIYSDSTFSDSILWFTVLFRSILIFVLIIMSISLFFKGVVSNNALDNRIKNTLTIPVSLVIFLLCFELAFMFIPKSHGSGITLSERIWTSLYWKPTNSLGYRDREITYDKPSTQNILVVGDSFTEGHGISSVDSRFSNILAKKLGTSYRVYNLGESGADSRKEYSNLYTFPSKPHIILLQYFGNDIEEACKEKGKWFRGFEYYSHLGQFRKYLVKNSFFLNFLYWVFPHTAGDNRYSDYMSDCYGDEIILEAHLNDLDLFVEYADNKGVPLFVVIFPFLDDNSDSINKYVPVISSHFNMRNVTVISVSDLIRGVPHIKRVVNRSDTHASPLVNRIVADAIFEHMNRRRMPPAMQSEAKASAPP